MSMTISVDSIRVNRDCARVVLLGVPDVPGVSARVFSNLASRKVRVEMILQNTMRGGRTDMAFLVHLNRLDDALLLCQEAAESIGAQGVSFSTDVVCISIHSHELVENPSVVSKIFEALGKADVNIEMITSDTLAVSCIVKAAFLDQALKALENTFTQTPWNSPQAL